jgi:hypothetical protein
MTTPTLPPLPVLLPLRHSEAGAFGNHSYLCQLDDGRLRLDVYGTVSDAILTDRGPHRVCSMMSKNEARAVAQQLLDWAAT